MKTLIIAAILFLTINVFGQYKPNTYNTNTTSVVDSHVLSLFSGTAVTPIVVTNALVLGTYYTNSSSSNLLVRFSYTSGGVTASAGVFIYDSNAVQKSLIPLDSSSLDAESCSFWVNPSQYFYLVQNVGTTAIQAGSCQRIYTPANQVMVPSLATIDASQITTGTVDNARLSGDAQNVITNGVVFLNATNYGVVADGVTDTTTAMQSFLNRGGVLYLPYGRYLCQELTITNNTFLQGNNATLLYATNAQNTNIFVRCMLNTGITIRGITFDGQTFTNMANDGYTTYAGAKTVSSNPDTLGYWKFLGLRHGLQINTSSKGEISNVKITRFSGRGLVPYSSVGTDSFLKPSLSVFGVECCTNFVGFASDAQVADQFTGYIEASWWTNEVPGCLPSEYMGYWDMRCHDNVIGAIANAANTTYTLCDFTHNKLDVGTTGASTAAGGNADHGAFINCLFNHDTGWAVYWKGSTSGMKWVGCHFRGGNEAIVWDGCRGMEMQSCDFAPFNFTNLNTFAGGNNRLVNNQYSGKFSSAGFSTDGKLEHRGNYSYDTIGDNDAAYNSGSFTGFWTNGTGMSVLVNMSSGTGVSVFNALGTNTIPSAANPSQFIIPFRGWTTNSAGTGYYYGIQ